MPSKIITRTRSLTTYRKRKKGGYRIKRSNVRSNTRAIRKIKSLIEKKHIDKVISTSFGTDAIPGNLHLMAEGDTSETRTGLKISSKNLYINLSLQWKVTATQETTARFIVFVDKLSNGALPSSTQLLESMATTSLLNNKYEGRRFIVLYDKLFNNRNVNSTVSKLEGYSIKIPINRNIWYLDSTATATALGRNSIYYLCVGDVYMADADSVAVTGNARLYYEDL